MLALALCFGAWAAHAQPAGLATVALEDMTWVELRDQVREGFEAAWKTFPDAAWLDGDHFVIGDRGVSETTFKGTKADGSRVEARMVDVFTFKNGKIAVKNAFRKDRPALARA